MAMSFVLFLITLLLLFFDTSFQKTVAANIMAVFNLILNLIVAYGFGAIDFYGYDSTGAVVHNVYSDMYPFIYIYWVFGWINVMLLFYCLYVYLKKPWDEYTSGRDQVNDEETQYYGRQF